MLALNRKVLSFFLKVRRAESSHLRVGGREFHARGAEIANARGPNVEQENRGTNRSPAAEERRFDRDGTMDTGAIIRPM